MIFGLEWTNEGVIEFGWKVDLAVYLPFRRSMCIMPAVATITVLRILISPWRCQTIPHKNMRYPIITITITITGRTLIT